MGCLTGLIIGITAGNQKKSSEYRSIILALNGSIWERQPGERVIPDVLVADTVTSEAYNYCANLVPHLQRVEIVTVQWLEDCQKHNRRLEFEKYVCPPFLSCEICATMFDATEKEQLKKLVQQGGGKWAPALLLNSATHLVCNADNSDKYVHASQTNRIFIVTKQWVLESSRLKKRLDESGFWYGEAPQWMVARRCCADTGKSNLQENQNYLQQQSDGQNVQENNIQNNKQNQLQKELQQQQSVNQFSKNQQQQNFNSSEVSFQGKGRGRGRGRGRGSFQALQQIQQKIYEPQNSNQPDSVNNKNFNANNSNNNQECVSELDQNQYSGLSTSLAWAKFVSFGLDDDQDIVFTKFLCTHTGGHKLCYYPGFGLHPRTTHIILNQSSITQENFAAIENHLRQYGSFSVQIISFDWIKTCDDQQKIVDEEQFEIPIEQLQTLFPGNSNLNLNLNLVGERNQHNSQSNTDSATLFSCQNNLQPGKPFFSMYFTLSALESQEQSQARNLIREGGGTVINPQQFSGQNLNSNLNLQILAVTPAGLPQQRVQQLRKKFADFKQVSSDNYLTVFWLKDCVARNDRMEWNSSGNQQSLEGILYRPVGAKLPIKEFQKFCFCFSQFQLEDVKKIEYLVGVLGGKFTGDLHVDVNTHLVVQKSEGLKYEYARRKNITVVTKEWLLDCYCGGHVVHLKDKPIYRPTGYIDYTNTTNNSQTTSQQGVKRSQQSARGQGGSQLRHQPLFKNQGGSKRRRQESSQCNNNNSLFTSPFVEEEQQNNTDENCNRKSNRNSIVSKIRALDMEGGSQAVLQQMQGQEQQEVQVQPLQNQAVLQGKQRDDGTPQRDVDNMVGGGDGEQQEAADMMDLDIDNFCTPVQNLPTVQEDSKPVGEKRTFDEAALKNFNEGLAAPLPDSLEITQVDQVQMPPPPRFLPPRFTSNNSDDATKKVKIIPGDEFQSQIINSQAVFMRSACERYEQLCQKKGEAGRRPGKTDAGRGY